MARWSPTVLPSPEPAPFWGGFQAELSRSLAQSPGEAIAWERNQLAKRELDQREQARLARERELYHQQGYRPVREDDLDPAQVGDAGVQDARKDRSRPAVTLEGQMLQYDPKAVAREQAEAEGELTRAQIATRQGILREGTPSRPEDFEQVRANILPGMPMVPGKAKENFFAAALTPEARADYVLTGDVPRASQRASARGPAPRLIRKADGSYAWADPTTGEFEDTGVQGYNGYRNPARTEADRIAAADNALWMRVYHDKMNPTGKWAVAATPEEARAAADEAVRAAIQSRRMRQGNGAL